MIEEFASDYIKVVSDGLASTKVTDRNGQEISLDEGLELWAVQARKVQQETKGLLFSVAMEQVPLWQSTCHMTGSRML